MRKLYNMKVISYILVIFFFSNCCSAQHHRLIEATHTTILGGVKGARSENFNIVIKSNSRIQPKYLLIENVKIPLVQEHRNGNVYLKGIYFPEYSRVTIGIDGEIQNQDANKISDYSNAYLVSENIKNKRELKQKIKLNNNENNNKILLNEKLPE